MVMPEYQRQMLASEHEYWMRQLASSAWEMLANAPESTIECPECGVSWIPGFDTHECHNKAPWWEQDRKGTNIPWELGESPILLAACVSLFLVNKLRMKVNFSNTKAVTKDLHLIHESAI